MARTTKRRSAQNGASFLQLFFGLKKRQRARAMAAKDRTRYAGGAQRCSCCRGSSQTKKQRARSELRDDEHRLWCRCDRTTAVMQLPLRQRGMPLKLKCRIAPVGGGERWKRE